MTKLSDYVMEFVAASLHRQVRGQRAIPPSKDTPSAVFRESVSLSNMCPPTAMRPIRPYQIFTLLDDPPNARFATVKIPQRQDLKLLETFLLIAACRITMARRVFEFGTFLGSTTLNLAMALPADGRVYTFDLDVSSAAGVQQHPADARLTSQHLGTSSLDFVGTVAEKKITTLTGNSLFADFSEYQSSIDLIFIDGGHDFATITADTENAFRMVRPGGCIAWHDFGNPTYPDVAVYLNELSLRRKLVFVEDTMLCFYFEGRDIH